MSRRFQEIEAAAAAQFQAAKETLLSLHPDVRAMLFAWQCVYIRDDGHLFSPQLSTRRRFIVLDGVNYWLVEKPRQKKKHS